MPMILITAANRNVSSTARCRYGMNDSSVRDRISKSSFTRTWKKAKARKAINICNFSNKCNYDEEFRAIFQQICLIFFSLCSRGHDNGLNVFIKSNYGFDNILTGAVNVILSLFSRVHRLKNEKHGRWRWWETKNEGERNNWTLELMNHRTLYYAIIISSITGFCCCCWWLRHEIKKLKPRWWFTSIRLMEKMYTFRGRWLLDFGVVFREPSVFIRLISMKFAFFLWIRNWFF